ncbi:PIN domain nuclease [Nocardia mangyaensis]|uniref:PIN domain nuclease n=1 Tax=Nocardia mangyaensis TaxID=2213200 RepID=UPI00267655D9|nr:PIN domain nuclease [Nocardia mangyaensis]MDO3649782.1 PIN domain nuclease [Nocardia mangyaensis]
MISYLIDTSAAVRLLANPVVRKAWHETVSAGVVALCDVVELELLFSATSITDRRRKKERLNDLFSWVPTPEGVWTRAHEVQNLLTEEGHHRSAGVSDLLIAATAEANRVTVLHYDRDYETLAKATGQPTQWITPPGTIS